jgi:hypothetical protein
MFATRPSLTQSLPVWNTIGMVGVAAFAARPGAALRWQRSHSSAGERDQPLTPAVDRTDHSPNGIRLQHFVLPQALVPSARGGTPPRGSRAPSIGRYSEIRPPASSAVAREQIGDTLRPSALAVTRFITRSNLVDWSTGRSAGFAPRANLVDKVCCASEQVGNVGSV